jgi:hypothetical protein
MVAIAVEPPVALDVDVAFDPAVLVVVELDVAFDAAVLVVVELDDELLQPASPSAETAITARDHVRRRCMDQAPL